MKKIGLLALPLFFSAAAAFAQNAPTSGISESTDPSKVTEVERRAQELQSSQSGTSGASASGKSMSGTEHRARHGAHHKPHHMHHGADQSGGAMQGQGGSGSSQK
ncbi:hypothetical protein [Noviherbaspirillum pedocola]|uniref:Uncharacterized protein n=1 Tax=Noviherbaspirillum pedocola TaxID=2801341 RepID=A0A934SS25_9BURK|nr:hypothetical protein [Noviherbaspirillum pedocola]MBK4734223.1 hypothetical protein [Noviherbaspirillum pedocola]